MAKCLNCGHTVSNDYARVFSKREDGNVSACPECPDKKRTHTGEVRDARATRRKEGDTDFSRSENTKEGTDEDKDRVEKAAQ